MLGQQTAVEELITRREFRKAEILLAKTLRTTLTGAERAQTLLARARTRLLSGRLEDAIDDLESSRALVPDNFEHPEIIELCADCFFARFEQATVGFADRNDTVLAQSHYQKILDAFPTYPNLGWIYYQLGRIALTDSQIDHAEQLFRQALFTPSHVRILTACCYERLGFIAFYERRSLHEALGFLNKAVDTFPASESEMWLVQVHLLRSRVYREMHHYDQAVASIEHAVSVASSSLPESKSGLAEALLTAGEMMAGFEGHERSVIKYLQQFLQISRKPLGVDVTWSRVHEMLGDAYFRIGQFDASLEAYQAALQFNPYHPWATSLYYRIARSCYQQRDYEAAVRAINHMLAAAEADGENVEDYRVYDVLGNAQYALKHYSEAVKAYRLALQMAPPNAENVDKIKTYYQFARELS